jgi:teichuronic acid biosynthesis glycosyltransferase TuaC
MRILVVSNMFPTPVEPWFGSFVRDQIDDIATRGHDVDVHSFDGRKHATEYLRAPRRISARIRRGEYDVVHAHYGLKGANTLLARPPIPLVTTFHGSDYSGPGWQRLVSMAVARRSRCVVVSEQGRRLLRALDAEVIPMGVDTQLFVPTDRSEARAALGWDPHARYALLAGSRQNRIKRADLFDAAVEAARVTTPHLRGVALEGFDRKGVVLALNAADVVVVASDHEGSPLTVREALACSTPVVSVDAGDVPSTIAGLSGCAVVARSPAALAEGIVRALVSERDDNLRSRAELTSRSAIAERIENLYARAVARGLRG